MVDWSIFDKVNSVGISAGASAPECLVEELISEIGSRYETTVNFLPVIEENVSFKMPQILRKS